MARFKPNSVAAPATQGPTPLLREKSPQGDPKEKAPDSNEPPKGEEENVVEVDSDEEPEFLPTKSELLREEAKSLDHLVTHIPKNPFCPACQRAKMQTKGNYSRKGNPAAEQCERKFRHLTADHFVAKDELDQSIDGDKAGLVIKCKGSGWLSLYATKDRSASEAENALIDMVFTFMEG